MIDEDDKSGMDWASWCPHCWNVKTTEDYFNSADSRPPQWFECCGRPMLLGQVPTGSMNLADKCRKKRMGVMATMPRQ
jgi:hypothetical protein